jgi:two-component system cell cycle sensor histidine kinase/response regulator CckA
MKYFLLISNELSFLRGFAEHFRSCSGKSMVINANTTKKAFEMLKTAKMDAVVVDMTMPELEGNEMIQHLRLRYPELPVILMTPDSRMSADWCLNSLTSAEYIRKPAHPGENAESVLSLMKTSRKDSSMETIT